MPLNKIQNITAYFPELPYKNNKSWRAELEMRLKINQHIMQLQPELTLDNKSLTSGVPHTEDIHIKDNQIVIKRTTLTTPDIKGQGSHISMNVSTNPESKGISEKLIAKFTELAHSMGAEKVKLVNTLETFSKIGKLSVAAQVALASLNSVKNYQDAAEKIQPFVDSKDVSPETARDYAAAAAQTALINASPMAHDLSLAAMPLAQWVHEHPEVPNKVLDELGLSHVREMQNLMTPGAQEMS